MTYIGRNCQDVFLDIYHNLHKPDSYVYMHEGIRHRSPRESNSAPQSSKWHQESSLHPSIHTYLGLGIVVRSQIGGVLGLLQCVGDEVHSGGGDVDNFVAHLLGLGVV